MEARRHTLRTFDERLEDIAKRTLSLAAAVEHQYYLVARALTDHEEGTLERAIAEDRQVDLAEMEIDELVLSSLLALSPVASDLRRMLATTKTARELERAGDEATGAAKQLAHLDDTERLSQLDEPLAKVACQVAEQIDQACVALVTLDVDLARSTIIADKKINASVRATRRKTLELSDKIAVVLPYIAVGRCIERGGDHAKVIAKLALGAATGTDPRHIRSRTAG